MSLCSIEAHTIRGGSAGDFVALKFTDTGIGMSQDTVNRIFEPFFTTKPADRGTGLGLSTCERILKRSGGFIHVGSVLGKGTTFTIYFPRTAFAAPVGKEPSEDAAPASTGNKTILVVEDEEAVRMFTARVLEELEYTVVEAANGCEALKEVSIRPGGFDLIIADLLMPQMGGRQLVESARTFADPSCDIRVLFMSGYTDEDIIDDPAFGSEVAFLQKPFTVEILARTVRDILNATSSSVCVGA
jgi:two-component system, cell cycle sensor histidine kinase and response regulator CckA